MATKARLRKEAREHKQRVKNGVSSIGSIIIGLITVVLPRSPLWIALDLALAFVVSLYIVWYCWTLTSTPAKRVVFFVLHAAVVTIIGSLVWPRIKVSPEAVSFRGFANETFNFAVKNDTESNAYLLHLPFLVQKGLDGKIEASLAKSEEDEKLPIKDEFSYCFAKNGDEFLVVNIPTLESHELRHFTITSHGERSFSAKATEPFFSAEQASYSPNQQTFGIANNDYRVCHIMGNIKGVGGLQSPTMQ